MIKIIDYKAGNAPSVAHSVKRLGYDCQLVNSGDQFKNATHIILPGVGSAEATMQSLKDMGILAKLEASVLKDKIPYLGICVGMQVLFEHSAEGNVDCLGWLEGRVIKFDIAKVRVPQMGYNSVIFNKSHITAKDQTDYYYFVNSFYAKPKNKADILGTTIYEKDIPFASAVNSGNIFGMQFHVEKSGEAGLELINSFLKLNKGDFA